MAAEPYQRRLAAIMAADIVGYSRAMEADEEGTYSQLRTLSSDLIEPALAACSGRMVKTMGDGFLAEFRSSVDALRCALRLQRQLAERNADRPQDQRVQLRIGINLGDIIVEEADIYGTGVNVAARLEAMAEPGGICISGRVFEDAERLVDTRFEHLGAQKVKNIDRPIDVYAVQVTGAERPAKRAPARTRRPLRLAIPAALLLAGLGLTGAWMYRMPDRAALPAAEPAEALSLPDVPSIAVLPFADLGGGEEQRYFADGIAEDLTTDLSKVSGLFVIARNSAFAFRDPERPVDEIAAALGVRYILQGSVRRAGGRLRINAQLADATRGETVWADRYDGAADDIFALQDAVARQIVSVLSVELRGDEEARIARQETDNPDAHDAFLRGWERYQSPSPESLARAIRHFEEAVALDPEYGRAHAALAAVHWQIARRWWHGHFDFANVHAAMTEAETLLVRALRWETPLAHQVATSMLSQKGRHTAALAEGAKAIALDPNDADSLVALAGALSLAGDPDQAMTLIEKAKRLNPRSPGHYYYEEGLAEFGLGNFSRAVEALHEAVRLNPDDRWSKRLLVASYGHIGQRDASAAIVADTDGSWYGTDPFTVRAVTYWYPYKEPADRERLVEGLLKAGLPD